ncbi:MAG: hypothetical protein NXI32_21470 [bacterium]|nr:hypothetical protein [bacterium]
MTLLTSGPPAEAQQTEAEDGAATTIDPATLLPAPLTVKSSIDFSDSSLRELIEWLRQEQQLVVMLDKNELSRIRVSPAEPIQDRLRDSPIYLLLNRLSTLDVSWYFDDQILYITSSEAASRRLQTRSYNVGNLLDLGYAMPRLLEVITETLHPDSWLAVGGEGVVNPLGDVLFVRQNAAIQTEVTALLEALSNHGRQTFINDPSEHFELRAALEREVTIDLVEVPLETAVVRLAEQAETDIRLDRGSLNMMGIREREPVSVSLANQKLSTVLQALLLDLELTWVLRDGVLWLTSEDDANHYQKAAVYDVRDLCSDERATTALIDAIQAQAQPEAWTESGGVGSIAMARAGTIVVSNQERIHNEVAELLSAFRRALANSKPRQNAINPLDEIVTVYYRLHSDIARDLSELLPRLVAYDSWKTATQPDQQGELFVVSSIPEWPASAKTSSDPFSANQNEKGGSQDPIEPILQYYSRSVLIVRQTRPVHDQIREIIRRVEAGDDAQSSKMRSMSQGMGGMFRVLDASYKSR